MLASWTKEEHKTILTQCKKIFQTVTIRGLFRQGSKNKESVSFGKWQNLEQKGFGSFRFLLYHSSLNAAFMVARGTTKR
jgi:hypothetical protein